MFTLWPHIRLAGSGTYTNIVQFWQFVKYAKTLSQDMFANNYDVIPFDVQTHNN